MVKEKGVSHASRLAERGLLLRYGKREKE